MLLLLLLMLLLLLLWLLLFVVVVVVVAVAVAVAVVVAAVAAAAAVDAAAVAVAVATCAYPLLHPPAPFTLLHRCPCVYASLAQPFGCRRMLDALARLPSLTHAAAATSGWWTLHSHAR